MKGMFPTEVYGAQWKAHAGKKSMELNAFPVNKKKKQIPFITNVKKCSENCQMYLTL